MIRYAAYNEATGRITRTGQCTPEDLALQGAAIASDVADDRLHYIANGQIQLLPARPGPRFEWMGPVAGWVDQRTMAEVRAARWESIKAERERRLAGTFAHDGNVFDIDPVNIAGAAMDAREALIAGEAWSQVWVLSNNTTVTLTAAQMIALGRAAKAAVSALWGTSQFLRQQIDAATTPEQVAAVVWPEGA